MSIRLTAVAALVLAAACGEKARPQDTTPAPEIIVPPRVDQPAPGGLVRDGAGTAVDLATHWRSGLAVVVFYRGKW